MKSSDYITLGFIAIFVTVIGYFALNAILGDPSKEKYSFDYLPAVTSDLSLPNEEVFNSAAINPTVEVYTGNCEDTNKDGDLDEEERKACGLDEMETETGGSTSPDNLEENGGLSNEENANLNAQNGLARGTNSAQRAAVEEDINSYQEQQAQVQEQSDANDAARRETVSGS